MNNEVNNLNEAASRIKNLSWGFGANPSKLEILVAKGVEEYGPLRAFARNAIKPFPTVEDYLEARIGTRKVERGCVAGNSAIEDYKIVQSFLSQLPQ